MICKQHKAIKGKMNDMSYKGQLNPKMPFHHYKKKSCNYSFRNSMGSLPVLPPNCLSHGKQGKTEKLSQSRGAWRDVMAKCSMVLWMGS